MLQSTSAKSGGWGGGGGGGGGAGGPQAPPPSANFRRSSFPSFECLGSRFPAQSKPLMAFLLTLCHFTFFFTRKELTKNGLAFPRASAAFITELLPVFFLAASELGKTR